MTTTHHGQPGTQVGQRQDPVLAGAPSMPPSGPPGANWPYPPALPPRSASGKASAIAIGIAILIATAALVVGIIDLVRPAASAVPVGATPSPPSSLVPPSSADHTTAADKALCAAVAPLMGESDRIGKAFTSLGPPDSPASAAGVPKFVSDTRDWVARIQPVVDRHPDVDPYFHRMLQRFVDDQKSLALDLAAGPWQAYDQTIWNDGLGAENGPMSTCWALGIKW